MKPAVIDPKTTMRRTAADTLKPNGQNSRRQPKSINREEGTDSGSGEILCEDTRTREKPRADAGEDCRNAQCFLHGDLQMTPQSIRRREIFRRKVRFCDERIGIYRIKDSNLHSFSDNPLCMAADETLTELAESIRKFEMELRLLPLWTAISGGEISRLRSVLFHGK